MMMMIEKEDNDGGGGVASPGKAFPPPFLGFNAECQESPPQHSFPMIMHLGGGGVDITSSSATAIQSQQLDFSFSNEDSFFQQYTFGGAQPIRTISENSLSSSRSTTQLHNREHHHHRHLGLHRLQSSASSSYSHKSTTRMTGMTSFGGAGANNSRRNGGSISADQSAFCGRCGITVAREYSQNVFVILPFELANLISESNSSSNASSSSSSSYSSTFSSGVECCQRQLGSADAAELQRFVAAWQDHRENTVTSSFSSSDSRLPRLASIFVPPSMTYPPLSPVFVPLGFVAFLSSSPVSNDAKASLTEFLSDDRFQLSLCSYEAFRKFCQHQPLSVRSGGLNDATAASAGNEMTQPMNSLLYHFWRILLKPHFDLFPSILSDFIGRAWRDRTVAHSLAGTDNLFEFFYEVLQSQCSPEMFELFQENVRHEVHLEFRQLRHRSLYYSQTQTQPPPQQQQQRENSQLDCNNNERIPEEADETTEDDDFVEELEEKVDEEEQFEEVDRIVIERCRGFRMFAQIMNDFISDISSKLDCVASLQRLREEFLEHQIRHVIHQFQHTLSKPF